MRQKIEIKIENPTIFNEKIIFLSREYKHFVHLNTNSEKLDAGNKFLYSDFKSLTAFGSVSSTENTILSSENLKNYINSKKDWFFGFFSYDYKNMLENLSSENFDGINFPDYFFFNPEIVILEKANTFEIQYFEERINKEKLLSLIEKVNGLPNLINSETLNFKIKKRISKKKYLKKIKILKKHIKLGDIYEVNFCIEYFAQNSDINPEKTFIELNKLSPTPFAAFIKFNDKFLISASPERFLKKSGNKIISQPIKGTAARSKNPRKDFLNKKNLETSEKERSENIMITDLVRSDLSRTAASGSVSVDELCGIYAYKNVYQMISTISSTLKKDEMLIDTINYSFPPGSMTGAPKIRAMQIIENAEETKRGLYSGSVGYFSPDKDFDFNVVIRSILYNKTDKYVSFSVGSAITDKSVPEKEYEECLLKAETMKSVLLKY